eukprot:scaffold50939_cov58-Phaeocystis_antarctica.AAC.6
MRAARLPPARSDGTWRMLAAAAQHAGSIRSTPCISGGREQQRTAPSRSRAQTFQRRVGTNRRERPKQCTLHNLRGASSRASLHPLYTLSSSGGGIGGGGGGTAEGRSFTPNESAMEAAWGSIGGGGIGPLDFLRKVVGSLGKRRLLARRARASALGATTAPGAMMSIRFGPADGGGGGGLRAWVAGGIERATL